LQLPAGKHAACIGIFEIARPLRSPSCRTHRHAPKVRQPAMENDGRCDPGSLDSGYGREKPGKYGVRGSGRDCSEDSMSTKPSDLPPAAPEAAESYIVNEGKKRGSTRDVRPEAAYDRFYTVLRVHAGDAILTNNWHTNEV